MSVLILEDNPDTLKILENLVLSVDKKQDVYLTDNLDKAYRLALENSINLFLVDIILEKKKHGDTSGIYFVEKIRTIEKYWFVPVIFVTSLEDSQLYAYRKLHCFGYIEKPFDKKSVTELVREALKFNLKQDEDTTIFFRKDGIIYPIACKELLYIEMIKRKIKVHFVSGECLDIPYKPLSDIMRSADTPKLLQCSRNCIVNRDYIKNVDRANRYITLRGTNEKIEIGIRYREKLYEWLGLGCY